ncbi:MAG TPA: acyl-CoA dehydratase activase-related protein [Syntrophomonadaceae bacterium]|nr:acyl-CoA dehydratase activase-related protein [Syntrophomonadaceae bacterium]
MKITFPHMGNLHIPLKTLFSGLKQEVVVPPPITKRTLELGIKYSPEFACLPLKVNVGNFIEALEMGADTIVMAGGWGPCRFGYYAQVEREILNELGYSFRMVVLEAPDSRLSDLLKQIKAVGERVSIREAYRVLKLAWFKLIAIEELEKAVEYYLPRALNKDHVEKIFQRGLEEIDGASQRRQVKELVQKIKKDMQALPCHQTEVLRIGLVGEIYTVLEPSTNCDAARYMGRLNAEVIRSVYLSDWVNDHVLGGWAKKTNHRHIVNCARPYLNHWVGGCGQETVGSSVDFARRNFDGLIQIGPLTCMPEIVAQSVLGRVSREWEIPCMTIYFDEHSGAAGVYTRLEAFVDMLARKKGQPGQVGAAGLQTSRPGVSTC